MELATVNPRLSTKAQQDYELVIQARKGNQRAYSKLLERYQNSIYHNMLGMVKNSEDAHDLTMEAFGKAFRKLDSYAPTYAFSTWLFRIAINNGIDYIRKRRMYFMSIDDPISEDGERDFSGNLKADMRDPEEEVIREQMRQMMRKLVANLKGKYRIMIELRFFEELSYEEIANELDIPLGTVKAQLFRAKQILFEMMQHPEAAAHFESTTRKEKTISKPRKRRKPEMAQAS